MKKTLTRWLLHFRQHKTLIKSAVALALLQGSAQSLNAQVNSYTFAQSNGTYTSITGGTIVDTATVASTLDTKGWSINLPFQFFFNGIGYDSLFANSNGGITFGATTSSASTLISSTTSYNGAIACMNRDLWGMYGTPGTTTSGSAIITGVSSFYGLQAGKPIAGTGIATGATVLSWDEIAGTITMSANATSSSSASSRRWGVGVVQTLVTGTAPNRVFTIEWKDFSDYSVSVPNNGLLNFQVQLTETTNTIKFVYGSCQVLSTTARTNQVGLRGDAVTDFINRSSATDWSATIPGTSSTSSVTRSNVINPASGLTFTWVPPSCFAPVLTAVTNITPGSASLNWATPANLPSNGYDYFIATSATPAPGSATPPTGSVSSSSATTVNIGSLPPSTVYYYWVRANCGATQSVWSPTGSQTASFSTSPVNDNCAGAISLTPSATLACGATTAGTTLAATQSVEAAPTCSATGINDDVWYSFVATNSSHLVNITAATSTTASQVYSGACGNLAPLACASTSSGTLSQLITGLTAGSTYYIRVYTTSTSTTTSSDFSICVSTPPPPPVNDNCSGATALTPSSTCTGTPGTTDWATQSADAAPTCSATGINDDVWYSFVAAATDHTINITGATNTTGTAVYTGACGSLSQIPNACVTTSSGTSTVTAGGLTPGTTYYVRVYSTSTASITFSSFSICVISAPAPVCPTLSAPANAAAVNGTPTMSWSAVVNAAAYDIYLDGNTTPTTLYAANVTGTSYVVTTPLPVGTYYWYVVAKNAAGAATGCGTNTRNFVVGAAPANDLPVNAVTIAVNAACTGNPFTNANATQVAGEPWAACVGTNGFKSVWYKFDAPASGAVKITNDFTATLADSRVALFSATDASNFSTFNIIACDDDNGSTVSNKSVIYATGLTPLQTYYVAVDGLTGSTASGAFCLEVLEMTSAMIATSGTCATAGQSVPALGTYTGWSSITTSTGLLIANVKRNTAGNTGAAEYSYTSAQNINTGAVRSDATGLKYLDRNYRIAIAAGAPASTYDVRLFFLGSEMTSYTTAGGTATLANIGVTRQTGETGCNNDFSATNGATSFIAQDANGTLAGTINWIEFETPGFSNFYLNAGPVPLPVDLTFNGKNEGTVNQLNWNTTREQNFSHFELQRSADGISFSKLAVVDAKGIATGSKYAYTDERPLGGLNIYRLNLVDKDGKSTVSNVVKLMVKSGSGLSLNVYPNPVKQQLHVAIAGKIDGAGLIQVLDITGKVLQTLPVAANSMEIDMSHLASGMYMIRYTDSSHNTVLKVNKN